MLCIRQTSLNGDNETGIELTDSPNVNDKIILIRNQDVSYDLDF